MKCFIRSDINMTSFNYNSNDFLEIITHKNRIEESN